jgi:hypothetical protein
MLDSPMSKNENYEDTVNQQSSPQILIAAANLPIPGSTVLPPSG